jgi:hypothetical protein
VGKGFEKIDSPLHLADHELYPDDIFLVMRYRIKGNLAPGPHLRLEIQNSILAGWTGRRKDDFRRRFYVAVDRPSIHRFDGQVEKTGGEGEQPDRGQDPTGGAPMAGPPLESEQGK